MLKATHRADNPYATHIPALIALATQVRILRVVELGSGQYSTSVFLDRNLFPDLMDLRSYENDPEWAIKIKNALGGDPRLRIESHDQAMSSVAKTIDLTDVDLVLVDDSVDAKSRAATICQVANNMKPENVVVIHDYEVSQYQDAVESNRAKFKNIFIFKAYNPQTAVIWNNANISAEVMQRIDRTIKRYAKKFRPEHDERWSKLMKQK